MKNREKAKFLMQAYLSMIAGTAGLELNETHLLEIDEMVDCIIAAAVEEMEPEPEPTISFGVDVSF